MSIGREENKDKKNLICDNCLTRMGHWIANKIAALCVGIWAWASGGITRSPKKK